MGYIIFAGFVCFGLLILFGLILHVFYSSIPSYYVRVKSKILYFEERIRWTDSSDNCPEVSRTDYEPVIQYYFKDETYLYDGKISFMMKSVDFNKKIDIYIDPTNPKNARHRTA